MLILITLFLMLYLQLFSVLTDCGHTFYKDIRFWRTLVSLVGLTTVAIALS